MDFYDLLLAKKLGGGGGETVLINKDINANGTYNASSDSADGYKKVVVSVPNTYSAGDEGKVVSSGALVSQSSANYTSNNTYDTTLINSVTVNVDATLAYLNKQLTGDAVYTGNALSGVMLSGQTGITSLSFTNVTTFYALLPSGAFDKMTGLVSFSAPKLARTSDYLLSQCTSLTNVDLRELTDSGIGLFEGCTSLVNVALPKCNVAYNYSFRDCANLEKVDILLENYIGHEAFKRDVKLNTLVIRKNGVGALNTTNAFDNTPFANGGTGGTLYVPSAQISSYQSASNWSTILGYANNQIKSIESTHTDPNAPIDLTLYYADGTTIGA